MQRAEARPAAADQGTLEWLLAAAIGLVGLAICLPGLRLLQVLWTSSDFYGHAYAIPAVAGYLVHRNWAPIRDALRRLHPPAWGALVLLLVASAEGVLVLGDIGFGASLGIPVVLGAAAYAVGGAALLRPLLLPLVFLGFMVPPPAFLQDQLLIELKFLVTRVSVSWLQGLGETVTAEGNQVLIPGRTLFVADACSGLTSIVTLLPLSAIVAYFLSHGVWRRAVVVASVVPLAVGANIARVMLTVIMVSRWGAQYAEGFLHESFGLATYIAGTLALIAVTRLLR